ncbi:MAG: hypothetical protein N3E47_03610 [Candidatus Bathyarchaeota archaeon]|nr:hypothetical protein [Candidatus Bathyarchaeota archaeon]
MKTLREHYSRPEVQREILDFCRGRWVALHLLSSGGKLIFRRYADRHKPIKIESLADLDRINDCMLRSIYATANVYRRLNRVEDLYDQANIAYSTPTWDIDSDISNWRKTIQVAREILRFLGEWGIKRSIYIKWSGNGCHIHINERSISGNLIDKYNPLALAYAIVEYIKSKIPLDFAGALCNGKVIVENKMDLTRVFTCPLSLHRELDAICVCMRAEDLEKFTPEWIDPQKFKHNPDWREFKDGETDKLAEKAYKTVGENLFRPGKRRRKTKPLDKQILEWLQKKE